MKKIIHILFTNKILFIFLLFVGCKTFGTKNISKKLYNTLKEKFNISDQVLTKIDKNQRDEDLLSLSQSEFFNLLNLDQNDKNKINYSDIKKEFKISNQDEKVDIVINNDRFFNTTKIEGTKEWLIDYLKFCGFKNPVSILNKIEKDKLEIIDTLKNNSDYCDLLEKNIKIDSLKNIQTIISFIYKIKSQKYFSQMLLIFYLKEFIIKYYVNYIKNKHKKLYSILQDEYKTLKNKSKNYKIIEKIINDKNFYSCKELTGNIFLFYSKRNLINFSDIKPTLKNNPKYKDDIYFKKFLDNTTNQNLKGEIEKINQIYLQLKSSKGLCFGLSILTGYYLSLSKILKKEYKNKNNLPIQKFGDSLAKIIVYSSLDPSEISLDQKDITQCLNDIETILLIQNENQDHWNPNNYIKQYDIVPLICTDTKNRSLIKTYSYTKKIIEELTIFQIIDKIIFNPSDPKITVDNIDKIINNTIDIFDEFKEQEKKYIKTQSYDTYKKNNQIKINTNYWEYDTEMHEMNLNDDEKYTLKFFNFQNQTEQKFIKEIQNLEFDVKKYHKLFNIDYLYVKKIIKKRLIVLDKINQFKKEEIKYNKYHKLKKDQNIFYDFSTMPLFKRRFYDKFFERKLEILKEKKIELKEYEEYSIENIELLLVFIKNNVSNVINALDPNNDKYFGIMGYIKYLKDFPNIKKSLKEIPNIKNKKISEISKCIKKFIINTETNHKINNNNESKENIKYEKTKIYMKKYGVILDEYNEIYQKLNTFKNLLENIKKIKIQEQEAIKYHNQKKYQKQNNIKQFEFDPNFEKNFKQRELQLFKKYNIQANDYNHLSLLDIENEKKILLNILYDLDLDILNPNRIYYSNNKGLLFKPKGDHARFLKFLEDFDKNKITIKNFLNKKHKEIKSKQLKKIFDMIKRYSSSIENIKNKNKNKIKKLLNTDAYKFLTKRRKYDIYKFDFVKNNLEEKQDDYNIEEKQDDYNIEKTKTYNYDMIKVEIENTNFVLNKIQQFVSKPNDHHKKELKKYNIQINECNLFKNLKDIEYEIKILKDIQNILDTTKTNSDIEIQKFLYFYEKFNVSKKLFEKLKADHKEKIKSPRIQQIISTITNYFNSYSEIIDSLEIRKIEYMLNFKEFNFLFDGKSYKHDSYNQNSNNSKKSAKEILYSLYLPCQKKLSIFTYQKLRKLEIEINDWIYEYNITKLIKSINQKSSFSLVNQFYRENKNSNIKKSALDKYMEYFSPTYIVDDKKDFNYLTDVFGIFNKIIKHEYKDYYFDITQFNYSDFINEKLSTSKKEEIILNFIKKNYVNFCDDWSINSIIYGKKRKIYSHKVPKKEIIEITKNLKEDELNIISIDNSKNGTQYKGHAVLLIKKNKYYLYYDPNYGICKNITFDKLYTDYLENLLSTDFFDGKTETVCFDYHSFKISK